MKWLRTTAQVLVAGSLCALFACTKGGSGSATPQAVLENYVKIAFASESADEKRKGLLDLSTGEAKEWLDSMTPETFKTQFADNHMLLKSFTTKDLVQDKNGDVSLVYEIAFKDGAANGDPTHQAVYTNKKIAYLHKDGDQWKIKATKNMKTYIERKDALEIPPNPPGYKDTDASDAQSQGK